MVGTSGRIQPLAQDCGRTCSSHGESPVVRINNRVEQGKFQNLARPTERLRGCVVSACAHTMPQPPESCTQDSGRTCSSHGESPVVRINNRVEQGKFQNLARPTGLEPVTPGLEGRCSIRMSYGRVGWVMVNVREIIMRQSTGDCFSCRGHEEKLVGVIGFEPTTSCSQSKRATGLRHTPNTAKTSRNYTCRPHIRQRLWQTKRHRERCLFC